MSIYYLTYFVYAEAYFNHQSSPSMLTPTVAANNADCTFKDSQFYEHQLLYHVALQDSTFIHVDVEEFMPWWREA